MLWDVTKKTVRLDNGRTDGPHFLVTVDDTVTNLNGQINSYFGPEKNDAQYTSPEDGVVEAKVQFTPTNPPPAGWIRDRETPYEYVVMYRAVRRPA